MRILISIIFLCLILILGACAIISLKSRKANGRIVAMLVGALLVPVLGNLLIVASDKEVLSTIGCYIYFIGMNLTMVALIRFTLDYCGHTKYLKLVKWTFYTLLVLDAIQLLVNIFTHHAFTMEVIEAYGSTYYRFIPHAGQVVHRVIDYFILGGVLINLIVKTFRTPRIYAEKYIVIIIAMLAVAAWQTFYIFSRTPVDISMIGFAVFGLLIFYFALYYRPMRLLDRMLATIASRMPDALFFFEKTGRCIWANDKGLAFLGITNGELDYVGKLLNQKLGVFAKEGNDWENSYINTNGGELVSYVIEKRSVIDDRNHIVGSYLSIRDNSLEQKTLQKETFNATHDALTKAYNRAGYEGLIKEKDMSKSFLVLLDIDRFKITNDEYGHTVGDKVLIKFVELVNQHFRDQDYVCRIGGDEFAIIMMNVNEKTPQVVEQKIMSINDKLADPGNGLPYVSISAGGAFGKDANNVYKLFNNADRALYETKAKGKRGFTLYVKK